MKVLKILIGLLLCLNMSAQEPTLSLASTWHNGGTNNLFKDIWGYHQDGREYAITGNVTHIFFIDVTDPFFPVVIDSFAGGDSPAVRDFKTYKDRAYAISGGGGVKEGLMIFDLSDLPNSVRKTYQSTDLVPSTHNCFIEEATGRLYTTNGHILDLSNDPDNPILLAEVPDIRGHDLFVRDNIAYVSDGFSGYYIYDVADYNNVSFIAHINTNGYNHSSWLSDDSRYAYYAEETSGIPLGIIDLSRMYDNDLEIVSLFKEPLLAPEDEGSIAHNPFLRENFLFVSYYEDGVLVFDVSDPENPKRVAYYDTQPDNESYSGFKGCWGVYPFLPSGNIIASDQDFGLFVFQFSGFNKTPSDAEIWRPCRIFPNPVKDEINLVIHARPEGGDVAIQLFDITGKPMSNWEYNINGFQSTSLDVSKLPKGAYFLQLKESFGNSTCKILKQ